MDKYVVQVGRDVSYVIFYRLIAYIYRIISISSVLS